MWQEAKHNVHDRVADSQQSIVENSGEDDNYPHQNLTILSGLPALDPV